MEDSYKETPQVYADKYYRVLSYPISYFLYSAKFGPNSVSVVAILIAVFAGFVTVYAGPFFGVLTFMFSYLLDFCDGNIARVMNKRGVFRSSGQRYAGIVLEELHANILYACFFGSLAYYLFNQSEQLIFLLVTYFLFSSKMILRYTRSQTARFLEESGNAPKENINKRYETKPLTRFKFFFSKVLFTPNLLLVLYMTVITINMHVLPYFFLAFCFLEFCYNTIATLHVVLKVNSVR